MSVRLNRAILDDGFATVRQASDYLGCSTRRVYNLAKSGILSSGVNGGRLVIPRASLRAYAAQNLRIGRVA